MRRVLKMGASMAVMSSLPLCEAFSCSPAMGKFETRAFASAVGGSASAMGKFETRAFAARSRNARLRSSEGDSNLAPGVITDDSDYRTHKAKGKERLLLIQNGSFGLGTTMILAAAFLHYFTQDDAALSGAIFKSGAYVFFVGVALQYSETYSRCSYIRFARETLMNPASLFPRARRVLRLVDGNIFKFLLPGIFGRSYDIVDGKPVQKENWEWKKTPWQDK